MSDLKSNAGGQRSGPRRQAAGEPGPTADQDWLMEQILENINNTPVGQVLKKIASLPEVRKKKILDIRQRLTEGQYNLEEGLDAALDRVLEELTA
jgi:hypothetical protein